jgi:hypothetical protein
MEQQGSTSAEQGGGRYHSEGCRVDTASVAPSTQASKEGSLMRWSGGTTEDEYGRVSVLERAEERPVLAVGLVVIAWALVVFVLATVYGMLV